MRVSVLEKGNVGRETSGILKQTKNETDRKEFRVQEKK